MDIEDSHDVSSDEIVKKKRRIERAQLPPPEPVEVVFPSKVWLKNIFPHFSIKNISKLERVSKAMKAIVTRFFHNTGGALERYFADSLHASRRGLETKFYHNGFVGNEKNAKTKRRIMHNAMENFILTAKNPMDGLRLLRASTDTELQKKFLEIDGNPTIHDIAIAATAISRTSHDTLNPTLFTNVAHALEKQPSGMENVRILTELAFTDLAKALNKCPNRNIVRPLFQPLLLNARRMSPGRAKDEFVSSMANTMGENASFFAHENLQEFQNSCNCSGWASASSRAPQ